MVYVVLALGSNVGNRREFLVRAVSELDDIARVVAKSKIYETAPWGYSQQRYFLNAAIGIETACGPLELLDYCKDVERRMGRVKTIENGPREIDLDIIFYGGESYSDEDLCIPHKRWRERDFVVTPLLDLLDAGFFDSGFFSEQKKLLKTMSRLYPPFSAF